MSHEVFLWGGFGVERLIWLDLCYTWLQSAGLHLLSCTCQSLIDSPYVSLASVPGSAAIIPLLVRWIFMHCSVIPSYCGSVFSYAKAPTLGLHLHPDSNRNTHCDQQDLRQFVYDKVVQHDLNCNPQYRWVRTSKDIKCSMWPPHVQKMLKRAFHYLFLEILKALCCGRQISVLEWDIKL